MSIAADTPLTTVIARARVQGVTLEAMLEAFASASHDDVRLEA